MERKNTKLYFSRFHQDNIQIENFKNANTSLVTYLIQEFLTPKLKGYDDKIFS